MGVSLEHKHSGPQTDTKKTAQETISKKRVIMSNKVLDSEFKNKPCCYHINQDWSMLTSPLLLNIGISFLAASRHVWDGTDGA